MKAKSRKHTTVHLTTEVLEQVDVLCAKFHISRSAAVAQAIARWYHNEPLVREKGNGQVEVP